MEIISIKLFILFVFSASDVLADVSSDIFLNEVRSLSQLPMDKLIGIKSTFSDQQIMEKSPAPLETDFEKSSVSLPIALPLKRQSLKPVRRHDDYWQDDKSKSSKISKVFQLSITALSFFAFGGYLLTLIITAIKRNAAATTSSSNVVLLQGLPTILRPKRNARFFDPIENDFNTERLYRGMIMLSEGYALYN